MKKLLLSILLLLSLLMLNSCADLLQFLKTQQVQKPSAQVVNGKITGLSFTNVDLLFDVQINNPNNIKIDLAGLDYNFQINSYSLVNGNKSDALIINANASSNVQIPVSLTYQDIYNTVKSLQSEKQSKYQFDGGVSFNLPVLGDVRIPVSFNGDIPLLHIPKISMKNISLKTLSWSGAELEMDFILKGQGGMDLFVNNLQYGSNIAGKNWVDGTVNSINLNSQEERTVNVPIKLSFLDMGRSIYNLITGDSELDYKLFGDFKISADHPLLQSASFSFEDISKIKINK